MVYRTIGFIHLSLANQAHNMHTFIQCNNTLFCIAKSKWQVFTQTVTMELNMNTTQKKIICLVYIWHEHCGGYTVRTCVMCLNLLL